MGNAMSYPIKSNVISHIDQKMYSSTGSLNEEMANNERVQIDCYNRMQQEFWGKIHEERIKQQEERKKLERIDYDKLVREWPQWTLDDITNFAVQFRTFDLNQDGLIDFEELCILLDQSGDQTAQEERQNLFNEVDIDKSGGVDFDEFLQLMNQFKSGNSMGEGFHFTAFMSEKAERALRIKHKLSVEQQLHFGVF
eukprot:Nk52_evm12s1020 gene=Nk52_evmTU12s1020